MQISPKIYFIISRLFLRPLPSSSKSDEWHEMEANERFDLIDAVLFCHEIFFYLSSILWFLFFFFSSFTIKIFIFFYLSLFFLPWDAFCFSEVWKNFETKSDGWLSIFVFLILFIFIWLKMFCFCRLFYIF